MTARRPSMICSMCKSCFAPEALRWRCDCGGYLDLDFDAHIDPGRIGRRPWGMWRYREAIPIDLAQEPTSFGEGATPLVSLERAQRAVHLKLEMLFPTGSFKDRGASVSVTRAVASGRRRVVEDSSGNAGASVSAYAALAGLSCEVFVPENTSHGKLVQMASYGARIVRVHGTREDAAQAAMKCLDDDTYYASHVWDPFFLHGIKTMAYETWEQLGGLVPDMMLIPTGNGSLILGTYLGFSDLRRQGLIRRLPRLVAVQAANCAPLLQRYRGESPASSRWTPTQAEGIAIAEPLRWEQILACVWDTGGTVVGVGEAQIREARAWLARRGLFVEPTAACGVAALDLVAPPRDACVVIPLTGHGLKTIPASPEDREG